MFKGKIPLFHNQIYYSTENERGTSGQLETESTELYLWNSLNFTKRLIYTGLKKKKKYTKH